MKQILILLTTLLLCISCKAQSLENKTFPDLEKLLIDFMISNGDVDKVHIEPLRAGKLHLSIIGLQNMTAKGELKNGIYSFSKPFAHSKIHFVLVEGSKIEILNLSNRVEVDLSIKKLLDFCERQKYCVGITKDYVSKLLSTFYAINKNQDTHIDGNCETGIIDTKSLP